MINGGRHGDPPLRGRMTMNAGQARGPAPTRPTARTAHPRSPRRNGPRRPLFTVHCSLFTVRCSLFAPIAKFQFDNRRSLRTSPPATPGVAAPLPDTGRGGKTPWRTRVAETSCTARELAFALVKKRTRPSYQRFSAYRCGALPAPPCVGEGQEISAEAEISGERSARRVAH